MKIEIADIRDREIDEILSFYATYGGGDLSWYRNKLQKDFNSGRLLGKLCIDSETNKIVGSYLGVSQTLLSNPALKSVQSIDTLIAPQARGGGSLRKVANTFYEHLANSGYDCVYGLPNKNIELVRFRVLGWNESRLTYRYFVPIPTFILRILFRIISLSRFGKISFTVKPKDINQIKELVMSNDRIEYIVNNGMLSCAYKSGILQKVGVVRTGQVLGFIGCLNALCHLAMRSKGLFLMTYATSDSETSSIFNRFSIKRKALKFSGLNLNKGHNYSFGEAPFEFVEFDTYGMI
jgi:hypothetical protein